jgi:DNA-binding helix-hairpin-helix protein with protein kinase domain
MAVAVAPVSAQSAATPGHLTGTRSGQTYRLSQEIGAGGNGVIYTVSRRPELVAKIYKHPLTQHDIDKLDALTRGATPELLSVAAWPIDLLKSPDGRIAGFVMPRILEARPLYELYSPSSRIQHFPSADFRFLLHAAANVARLFGAVHQAGFICGDVNHSNILARQMGTVAAVDCDSFQVGDGSRFPCLVATELFVPPELMGADLGTTKRTANHDTFGLAVLIFHLLFMGRHPFVGRFLGKGEMPIERAIAECRFAYSGDQRRTQMAPPPFTPPMATVGSELGRLFEQAFHPDNRVGGRPSHEDWIGALDSLKASLVPCREVAWHHHLPSTACPWCAIEGPARIKLFGGVSTIGTAAIADLETLWARYLALITPPPKRPLPKVVRMKPRLKPKLPRTPLLKRFRADRIFWLGWLLYVLYTVASILTGNPLTAPERAALAIANVLNGLSIPATVHVITGALIFIPLAGPLLASIASLILKLLAKLFLWPDPNRSKPSPIRRSRRESRQAWKRATAAWHRQPTAPDVSDLRPAIEALKAELDALAVEREALIKACSATPSEDLQRSQYLARFRIESAKLHGFGPARCAVLRSWGIDTAADIDEAKILEIPGFGAALTGNLVAWRQGIEGGFVSSPILIVDPLDVHRIDRQLAASRTKLMRELRERIAEVEARIGPYLRERDVLWAEVERAFEARMQAVV